MKASTHAADHLPVIGAALPIRLGLSSPDTDPLPDDALRGSRGRVSPRQPALTASGVSEGSAIGRLEPSEDRPQDHEPHHRCQGVKVRVATALTVLVLLPGCTSAASAPDPNAQMCQGFRESDAVLLLDPVRLVGALADPAVADPSRAEVEEVVRAVQALATAAPSDMRPTVLAYIAPLAKTVEEPGFDLATREAARDLISPHMVAAGDLVLACPPSA